MFAGPNTIAINLGDYLQGKAEGPLGISALLIIFVVIVLAAELRRRR
jgi:hypothetical protein